MGRVKAYLLGLLVGLLAFLCIATCSPTPPQSAPKPLDPIEQARMECLVKGNVFAEQITARDTLTMWCIDPKAHNPPPEKTRENRRDS